MTENRNSAADIVRNTQAYYDGAAHEIYRDIWGENIHIGFFSEPNESLRSAMETSNQKISERVGLGPQDYVLDVGAAHGALARYLARTYGCKVLATDISERELEHGRELTEQAGMSDQIKFERADFHNLQYADNTFDFYTCQESFLHAGDKEKVLSEAMRVLKPGGKLVFTDLLVRHGTSQEDRERIYARVGSPDMWDGDDYLKALERLGFTIVIHEDWSQNVAPTYAWVRGQLEERRAEFEERIGKDVVDRTSTALQFWVDSANAGKIGWAYYVAQK